MKPVCDLSEFPTCMLRVSQGPGDWVAGVTALIDGCVALSFQKLKTQMKGRDQWARLRRYSVILQKENLKK